MAVQGGRQSKTPDRRKTSHPAVFFRQSLLLGELLRQLLGDAQILLNILHRVAVHRGNTDGAGEAHALHDALGVHAAVHALEHGDAALLILLHTLGHIHAVDTHGHDQVTVRQILGVHIDVDARDVAQAGAAYADDILTMSTVTGLSTDALQEYRYMADLVDVSVETITGSITKLTRNMLQARDGTGEQAEAFAALGIQITNADGSLRDAQEVWDEVITALGQMSNETERDAYAMVLMGKSAQDLNPLIEAGADKINALRQEAHEAGAVLDEDMLATLGEMQDAFDRLSQQTDAFEHILSGTLAPTITDIVNAIVGAIQQMGNFIQRVQEAKQAIDELAERNAAVGVAKESLGWIRDISLEGMVSQIPFLNIPYNFYKGAKWLSGSHAAGLDRVPYDGYLAELHADEAVLNAQEAALWRSVGRSGARALPAAYSPAALPANAQSAARRENVTIDVTLELDGQTLARKQYPLMQAEGRRRGTPLAGKEGT